MNCPHCGSSMILKKIYDYGGYSWGWKCIVCGEVVYQIKPKMETRRREYLIPEHLGGTIGWS